MRPDMAASPSESPATPADLAGVTVVIPAYNEEQALPHVLADLPRVGRVIVVNNGSTDTTAAVAFARGATVVHEWERGYGAACLRGLAAVEELIATGEEPPRAVVFLDGDYSDDPRILPEVVAPILDGAADFVLGSRLEGRREAGAMPWHSMLGNRLACFLMRMVVGVAYTDLGPLRAISYPALQIIGMTDRGFGWTIEMQLKAAQNGLRIVEIPVPYRRRIGQSKISGTLSGSLKAGTKILYTIAKYAMQGKRDKE